MLGGVRGGAGQHFEGQRFNTYGGFSKTIRVPYGFCLVFDFRQWNALIFFDFIFPSPLYGTVKYGRRSGTRAYEWFVVFPALVQRRRAVFISHYRFRKNNYC